MLRSEVRILHCPLNYRGVEQLAARRAHNPEVVGSNPTPATYSRLGSSVVEQRTENPCVVSSILTRGTKNPYKMGLNLITGCGPVGKASGLGPEDRGFESRHPDGINRIIKKLKNLIFLYYYVMIFLLLINLFFIHYA